MAQQPSASSCTRLRDLCGPGKKFRRLAKPVVFAGLLLLLLDGRHNIKPCASIPTEEVECRQGALWPDNLGLIEESVLAQ